jgi:two-component system LytT family response regulator
MRVLIVDDEPWARRRIASLVEDAADVTVAAECGGGAEAVAAIQDDKPDLVFLDVQMPEIDGFDVLQAVGPERMPLVVFATAYDEYAVRAFEAHALDYLLKPFDDDRLRQALDRAREELARRRVHGGGLQALVESLRRDRRYLRRLVVKAHGRVLFLRAAEVDWLEAAANYVVLHVGSNEYLVRDTVADLEVKLDPEQFVRVHRSTIVNLDRVKELSAWARGEQALTLKDGTQLTVGRAFRSRLQRFLDNALD